MIQETIVITQNSQGIAHIAPMGIHIEADAFIIQPFKPSATLNNLLETHTGVINYCDDVRVFAGCLTGRKTGHCYLPKKSTDKCWLIRLRTPNSG